MNYRHKNLTQALARVIEHVTNNIQNQEKLSANMKRFRKGRIIIRKTQTLNDIEREDIESERNETE